MFTNLFEAADEFDYILGLIQDNLMCVSDAPLDRTSRVLSVNENRQKYLSRPIVR